MPNALYDLAKLPTTYDFSAWAVIARTRGATHCQFIYDGRLATWKYDEYTAWRRFATILLPITFLAGMSYYVGRKVEGETYPYLIGDVEKTYQELGRIELLKSVVAPTEAGYVTVTLRNSFRNKYRNSNMPEWEKFIEYLEKQGKKVVIFPECENAPIEVLHRMGVYAGADMNFGVNCGPMTLCLYSDAPYVMINVCPANTSDEKTYDMRKLLDGCGFHEGKQFSFRNDKQLIVWKPDTCDNLIEAYGQLQDRQPQAAISPAPSLSVVGGQGRMGNSERDLPSLH